jgi:hypothetical protein
VIDRIAQGATHAVAGRLWLASMVLLCGSAVLSAIVDNIAHQPGRQRRSRYLRIVLRSTPSDVATSVIERPAYQWMKISVTSTTPNVLEVTPDRTGPRSRAARALARSALTWSAPTSWTEAN